MRPWDQVKVKAPGDDEGKAGYILRSDQEGKVHTVKLDVDPENPRAFAESELEILVHA
jgi:hypothetical protein